MSLKGYRCPDEDSQRAFENAVERAVLQLHLQQHTRLCLATSKYSPRIAVAAGVVAAAAGHNHDAGVPWVLGDDLRVEPNVTSRATHFA